MLSRANNPGKVLADALADYLGTALTIAHDRYFLDQVFDRLLVVNAGEVVSHTGGYSAILAVTHENP